MSKCSKCGNELLTGDIHWELGWCNNCYNELYKVSDLEARLAEAQKPKEIRFNGFVVDCNYDEARKVLQEDLLKMQAENKKLKESEELSNYAKCILENKELEQEIQGLKQQLAEKDKEIEKILKENEELIIKYNVYNYGDKIQQDKVYSITGEALELLINRPDQKAIEQLEKVKELLNTDFESIISWIDPYEDGECLTSMTYNHNNTIKTIDNQIKQLKGEVYE